jgi:predicted signal transduction protein with EAL and GGDEF domain
VELTPWRSDATRTTPIGSKGPEADLASYLTREAAEQASPRAIETQAHVAELNKLGCDHGQGYFFSKPLAGKHVHRFYWSEHPE